MATWTLTGFRSVTATMAATESAPTGDDGLYLASVGGFSLGVKLDGANTFTGAVVGGLRAWLRLDDGVWHRAPELDLDIPADVVGLGTIVFTGWSVANPRGRIAHVTNGLLISGGGVNLRYDATEFSGRKDA